MICSKVGFWMPAITRAGIEHDLLVLDDVSGRKSVPFPVLRAVLLKVAEFSDVTELERDVEFVQIPVVREAESAVEIPVGPKNILEVFMGTSEEFFGDCDISGGRLFEKFENRTTGTLTDGLSAIQKSGQLAVKAKSIKAL